MRASVVNSRTVAPTRNAWTPCQRRCSKRCRLSPSSHDRVTAGDLGYRGKAVLTRYPEGILVQRSVANPIWIPQESITAIRSERGKLGKARSLNSILVIR